MTEGRYCPCIWNQQLNTTRFQQWRVVQINNSYDMHPETLQGSWMTSTTCWGTMILQRTPCTLCTTSDDARAICIQLLFNQESQQPSEGKQKWRLQIIFEPDQHKLTVLWKDVDNARMQSWPTCEWGKALLHRLGRSFQL